MSRYENEILTDNTKVEVCKVCKDCVNRRREDQGYKKAMCEVFKPGEWKPIEVLKNGDCEFYIKEKKP